MNYKKPTKAIVTDAGFASRFLPITKTVPKGMLPIGNRPAIQLVIEECLEAGIEEIILVVTPEGKNIYEDYFFNPVKNVEAQLAAQGKSDRFAPVKRVLAFPKITLITQDPTLPYGNGSPIASAKNLIPADEAFIALWSDDVVFGPSAVKELVESFEKHPDARAIIGCQLVPHAEISKYGAVDYDPDTEILRGLVEKPAPEEATSDLASYGRYLLTPEIFQHLIPENTGKDDELWLPEAIAKLIPTGHAYAKPTSGLWMTTGDPQNYSLALLKHILTTEDYAGEIRDFITKN